MLKIYFQSLDWVQNDLCAFYCTSVAEYCKAAVQQLLLNLSTSASISASVYCAEHLTRGLEKPFSISLLSATGVSQFTDPPSHCLGVDRP